MPSPFPGMDPYLEDPALWPDVHHGWLEAIWSERAPALVPRFYVRVEHRGPVPPPPLSPADAAWARAQIERWQAERSARPG